MHLATAIGIIVIACVCAVIGALMAVKRKNDQVEKEEKIRKESLTRDSAEWKIKRAENQREIQGYPGKEEVPEEILDVILDVWTDMQVLTGKAGENVEADEFGELYEIDCRMETYVFSRGFGRSYDGVWRFYSKEGQYVCARECRVELPASDFWRWIAVVPLGRGLSELHQGWTKKYSRRTCNINYIHRSIQEGKKTKIDDVTIHPYKEGSEQRAGWTILREALLDCGWDMRRTNLTSDTLRKLQKVGEDRLITGDIILKFLVDGDWDTFHKNLSRNMGAFIPPNAQFSTKGDVGSLTISHIDPGESRDIFKFYLERKRSF